MASFLDLPPELRLKVYDHVSDANPILNACSQTGLQCLRLTCRTVNNEVKHELSKNATFCIADSNHHDHLYHEPLDFLRTRHFPQGFLNRITNLTLSLHLSTFLDEQIYLKPAKLVREFKSLETLSIELWFANEQEATKEMLKRLEADIPISLRRSSALQGSAQICLTHVLSNMISEVPRGCQVTIKYTSDDLFSEPGTLACSTRGLESMDWSNILARVKEMWECLQPVSLALLGWTTLTL